MFTVEPKKEKLEVDIKNYQLSIKEKIGILFSNFEFGIPITESLKSAKFQTIDEFVDRIMFIHGKNCDRNQDFQFIIDMGPSTEEDVKKYLIEHKKFVLDYITSRENFKASHIYQLYLEYIPYVLNEVEKSILLDGYITMLTDLQGTEVSCEKRKRLEKRLHINQD